MADDDESDSYAKSDVKLKIKLDISKRDERDHFNSFELKETLIELKTYTIKIVKPFGVLNVTFKHNDQSAIKLPQYVVEHGGPLLFGRDWLSDIKLDWQQIKSLCQKKANIDLDIVLYTNGIVF